jgi:hypothetical protein
MIDKKVKGRSPAYPSMSLEEAIARARVIWQHAQRHPVSGPKLAAYWKYGEKSSGWRLAAAALKRFGLVDIVGNKKSGEVKLSDLGLRILLDSRNPSPERDAAIKEAALQPAIYADLWSHWGGVLPSDDTIGTYLMLDKGFTQASVLGFIRDFKRTIEFAKLTASDNMLAAGRGESEGEEVEADDSVDDDENDQTSNRQRRRPKMQGTKEDTYTLDDGQAVVLQWPEAISPDECEDLELWLQMMIRKVKRAATVREQAERDELSSGVRRRASARRMVDDAIVDPDDGIEPD